MTRHLNQHIDVNFHTTKYNYFKHKKDCSLSWKHCTESLHKTGYKIKGLPVTPAIPRHSCLHTLEAMDVGALEVNKGGLEDRVKFSMCLQ